MFKFQVAVWNQENGFEGKSCIVVIQRGIDDGTIIGSEASVGWRTKQVLTEILLVF